MKVEFDLCLINNILISFHFSLYHFQKALKHSGENQTDLMNQFLMEKLEITSMLDISVVHDSTQLISRKNPCENKGCSHICLLSQGPDEAICMCPEGMTSDFKNCSGKLKNLS